LTIRKNGFPEVQNLVVCALNIFGYIKTQRYENPISKNFNVNFMFGYYLRKVRGPNITGTISFL
jgi:hypothetical protein